MGRQREFLAAEIRRLDQARYYEARLTEAAIHELHVLLEEHVHLHDRDRHTYELEVDKRASELQGQLTTMKSDIERLRSGVGVQEDVTIAQTTRDTVLQGVQQNNRWLIGIIVANGLTLLALVLHLLRLY